MKAITTILLSLIINTVISQDIKFSTDKEVADAVVYLNKLRHSKEFVKQETGVEVEAVVNRKIKLDSTLCELAKLRVIEMIENDNLSHNSKYDKKWYAECIAYNWDSDIKDHIVQFIIDRSTPSLGHRKILIIDYGHRIAGIALGVSPNGKIFSCMLTSDGIDKTYIALK